VVGEVQSLHQRIVSMKMVNKKIQFGF
jgi:hypothetical protein